MSLKTQSEIMLPAIETELQRAVRSGQEGQWQDMYKMLAYHMGWEGDGAGPEAQGKRIRPLLVTLTTAACGKDWKAALPAAAAVELIHNFSLIHDDIQDNSPLRHGRPTVWKLWGIPQAINAGDALFTLAHLAVLRLEESTDLITVVQAAKQLQETCLNLTQGQYLDMAYENQMDLTLDGYWLMVGGKTASLLETCTALGAMVAQADSVTRRDYQDFGRSLGLAFQAQDDLLGIWGNAAFTGKSAESDLITGKKSLPILYGLQKGSDFAQRWRLGPVKPAEVTELAQLLENEGARAYTIEVANRLTKQALTALEAAQPQSEAGQELFELAYHLLNRLK